jgi:hypothetical protein
LKAHDSPTAIKHFEAALALDPQSSYAIQMLRRIKGVPRTT